MAAFGLTIALVATGCGGGGEEENAGGGDTGGGGNSNAAEGKTQGKKGGDLQLLLVDDFEHLDPARNYVATSLNFGGRLLYRSLTTYKAVEGKEGADVVPDLATDLGQASDDAKTWTFTLKDGLKYEDGSPIVAADVKYGVERTFSDLLPEGPQYARQYLAGTDDYKGPYVGDNNGGKGLESIQTPDDKTIVFTLKQPVGDFSYTVALPVFSPVPKAKDTKEQYDNRVFSSGPYKIDTYQRGKSLKLVRNDQWSADDVRGAYPDTITATMGVDPSVIDQRIIADAGQDQNAIMLDTSVQPESLATALNDPNVKERSVTGLSGFLRYVAMNTSKPPFDNVKVRQAVQFAVNKEAYRTARGGPIAGGDYANTMLIPTINGHQPFNLYEAPPQGDPDKAKQLLAEAGVTTPLKITFATTNVGKGVSTGEAIQAALARAGIEVTVDQKDPSVYYTEIGDAAKQPEMVTAAWGPDWPNASTVLPPLFDGRQIKQQGNQNFSQLNDPAINKEMDEISAITDLDEQGKRWGELDKKIMELAPVVPILYDKLLLVSGSKVQGDYIHAFYGEYDMASLSVA